MFRCQSSEQYTGFGGAWITKDRFISSLKRKFLITTDDTLHISPASVASIFNSRLAVGVVSYFEETYQTISPLLQIISSCMSVCVTHVRMCSCTHVSIYVGGVSIKLKRHSSITVHLILGDSISPYPWGFPTRLG